MKQVEQCDTVRSWTPEVASGPLGDKLLTIGGSLKQEKYGTQKHLNAIAPQ